ncbi:hypothetical protein Mame_00648 [Martelella mediterranea DSM 17316]|uniref:Tlde1 domain-containing protein n=1 Tax=Martelella mediterranea DSM 17316 TaxID=1122214 RepID=A0A1U9YX69_9HYPH|nr:hypothetical protein Mame_00648 [Martelella mediterranea DSM 17316]
MLRLSLACIMAAIAGGAIITIASSPIISATVSKPEFASSRGISLTVNPAFKAPERAQSAKEARLLAARTGQARAKPALAPDDIRQALLAGRLEQAGRMALADLQRGLVGRQIADNAGSEIALAGVPPELQPKAAAVPTPAAPSTTLAALAPSSDTNADDAFKLVLQGADSSRLSPGEVPVPAKRPAGMQLAYADFGHDDLDEIMGEVPGRTKKVAVYDISAAKVYMPDGEVMEAHSGKGKYRDNPNGTHVKMAGAVPAATYKLTMRESLFHGVPALRMTSVDGTNPLGRTGILAHTYMLRTPGDSHGCLVFKDYYKFLKAWKADKVDYIVAVPSLEEGASTLLANRSN